MWITDVRPRVAKKMATRMGAPKPQDGVQHAIIVSGWAQGLGQDTSPRRESRTPDRCLAIRRWPDVTLHPCDKSLCWDRASFLFRALFAVEVPARALGKHALEAAHKVHHQLRWRFRCTGQTIWAKP